ncbi:TIGR03915 family putative DNA repair protein [Filimonas effusa]|uniref:DNA metabolism protein n=1 Tax=Filimonas effusa TaxID=2508721 RepID=A0A4Q1D6V0_9BACT|nr:TIGR03915 family putative DNA repair protein [Filimonas effusa]RXK83756.1 DNA metabolism protein [Filimonas effusa]
MQLLVYDGSFAGILCAVFDVFEYKFKEVRLVLANTQSGLLFGREHTVITDETKAARVFTGLSKRISARALTQLRLAYLSEQADIAGILVHYMQYAFTSPTSVETDFSHPAVLSVAQVARKVNREKHRMEAFIRFQLTTDQIYYAVIEPDFNVLPVIANHFKERFADQDWLIYDARRKYGLHYNRQELTVATITFEGPVQAKNSSAVYDASETLYQELWRRYFNKTNIEARKNTRLHIRHMPLRYWKYLVEKQPVRS